MCYVDISSTSYSAKKNEALITGIDLDQVLLQNWDQEMTNMPEVVFRFDLSSKGPRVYLYKLLKSTVKEECTSMEDKLSKLTNRVVNISSNFLHHDKG